MREDALRALISEQAAFRELTLEHFLKCKKEKLTGFIAARQDEAVPASSLNKGTLQHEKDVGDCNILRAVECRSLPPLVVSTQEPPSVENTTTHESEQV